MDSAAWDARYAAEERVWSVEPNQFVAELASLPPGRAVDLACGEGRNALWLASLGWQVTGVDYSPVAIDKAAAQPSAVTWVTQDVLTWQGAGFDLAVIAYLQLPAEQRAVAVGNAWSSLKPGGRLFVVGHDSSNHTEGVGGPKDPAVLFTADDVLDALPDRREIVRAGRVPRVTEAGTAWGALVEVIKP